MAKPKGEVHKEATVTNSPVSRAQLQGKEALKLENAAREQGVY